MADVNFIEFGTAPFFLERTSPYVEQYQVRGIQLLPNNELPYIQTTNVSGGIELEDWTVYIVDPCGNETDISDYFVIEDVFADDNGDNQFTWSLTNVPHDFYYDLVHLKAVQSIGETFYSNYFMLTDLESDKTIRIDYKSYNMDTMQSIQLPMAFKQEFNPVEIESYYETSTKNTVINTVKYQTYESWLTEIISNDLLLRIIRVFSYKYTYVDLLRCNLFEAIEQKEYEAAENFKDNIIKLTFNKSDVYDPLANPITTPETIPSITLSSVVANSINAIYYFSYADFTPDYLVFEYSDDEIIWTSESLGTTSPQSVAFNESGTWYFRISHPLAISNTFVLELGSTVIANDDSANVGKGDFVDISVLFNDVLVGTTTITFVSVPTNGTATIIESGTKIRYTHDDGVSLVDSFTYTISNGITSDTATVNISVFGTGTSFEMSEEGLFSKPNACLLLPTTFKYHDGISAVPSIGDIVYNEVTMETTFTGFNKFYSIEGKVLKIANNGVITDVQFC